MSGLGKSNINSASDSITVVGTLTGITNPIAVTGTFWQSIQPVSGTVTANQGGAPWSENLTQYGGVAVGVGNAIHVQPGTGASFLTTNANIDVALSTRTKPSDQQHAIVDSGTLTGITNPVAVTGTFFQTTQPVSAVSLPLPANAAQETGNLATLVSLDTQQVEMLTLTRLVLAELRAIHMQLASMTGAHTNAALFDDQIILQ